MGLNCTSGMILNYFLRVAARVVLNRSSGMIFGSIFEGQGKEGRSEPHVWHDCESFFEGQLARVVLHRTSGMILESIFEGQGGRVGLNRTSGMILNDFFHGQKGGSA